MSIPINPVSPRVQYIAVAGDTIFDVPFPFFTNADLTVYYTPLGDVANDASDILVYSADYTVTGAGSATGGTIILNLPAANTGDLVTIVRSMLEQRLSLYLPGGLFTADQVNNDFSMDVMMSQQNQMQTQVLTPHYQFSAPVRPVDVNLPILPANSTWVMNSTSSQILPMVVTPSGGVLPISVPTQVGGIARFVDTQGTLQTEQWFVVSNAAPGQILAGENYITVAPGGILTLALPHFAAIGTQISVIGYTATGWRITQYPGQQIVYNGALSTVGVGGSLASSAALNNVTLRCIVANTVWSVTASSGALVLV